MLKSKPPSCWLILITPGVSVQGLQKANATTIRHARDQLGKGTGRTEGERAVVGEEGLRAWGLREERAEEEEPQTALQIRSSRTNCALREPRAHCPWAEPCTGQEQVSSSKPTTVSQRLAAAQRGHSLSINAAIDPQSMAAEGRWQLQASEQVLSWRERWAAHCHGCHRPLPVLHGSPPTSGERHPQSSCGPLLRKNSEEHMSRTNLAPITAIILRTATPHLHPPISI